ncbi:MAG: hypothetical protein PHD00_09860 [Bacteroidales bacterium]|nr:hypothetical protein [Bacteroidales bacterium]MDD4673902.1 hypothetical protein [Bacteroidales bacterium]
MKRIWILLFAVTLILSSCNGQEKQAESQNDKLSRLKNVPKEDIKINREYDEDGNLIKYDSTYTYFYSNIENDKAAEDSIFYDFRKMFDALYPFSYKPYFNDFFFEDSLLKYDFYKRDFFSERFRHNMEGTEKMFQEMDSIKNKYYMEKFPEEE